MASSLEAAPYDLPTGAGARALLLQRSASGIEDLLEQASDHVAAAMQQFDCVEQRRSSQAGGCALGSIAPSSNALTRRSKSLRTILVGILRRTLRGARTGKEDGAEPKIRREVDADEYQYRRLRSGFTGLLEHVRALDDSREGLKLAVEQLRVHGDALDRIAREASERENGDGRAPLSAMFVSYEPALKDVAMTLDERVAPITRTKLQQLQRFQDKLEEREALKTAVDQAKRQLVEVQDAFADGKKGVGSEHVRAASHAFHRQRRRLEAMTAALEHVFRFHYQLDQCVADPELRIVHHALSQLFARCLQTFD